MGDGFFGKTKQTAEYKPEKYDPVSPTVRAGADAVAAGVTKALPAAEGTADQSAGLFSEAAKDPTFSNTILPEYAKTIRGDYLSPQGNPALSAWLANLEAASNRNSATQRSRLSSRLASTGVNPTSTAFAQAGMGADASARSALETAKAGVIASNFNDERNRMLQSGSAYGSVAGQPGTLANMATSAKLSPYATAAQAISNSALPFQFQQSERAFTKTPGIADYLSLAMQAASTGAQIAAAA